MPKGVYKRTKSNPVNRFLAMIAVGESGCWVWQASGIPAGYGTFWDGNRKVLAHRWAYEHWVGPIPEELEMDHLCRNRACVSPFHLEPVTRSENGKRGHTGFHRREEAKLITHCPKGHEYDESNTRLRPNRSGGMSRHCRACQRARVSKWQRENKERVNQQQRKRYAGSKDQSGWRGGRATEVNCRPD